MSKRIKHVAAALVVLAAVGISTVVTPTPAVAADVWCDPQQPFTVGSSTLSCEGPQAGTLQGSTIATRAFQASLYVYDTSAPSLGTVPVTLQPWSTYSLDAGYQACLVEQQLASTIDGSGGGGNTIRPPISCGPDVLLVSNIVLTLACKPNCGIPPSPSPTQSQTISHGFPDETAPNYAPSVSYANLYYVTTFGSAPGKMGSTVVGYLYASSSNYVFCKTQYGTTTGPDGYNYWWMYTDLDTGGRGWVSAYYLSNYGNNQAYANGGGDIPICP